MKKRMIALSVVIGALCIPFGVSAEDSSLSATDILDKANEYQQSVTSMTMPMTMNFAGALKMSMSGMELTMDAKGSADINAEMIVEPMQMKMTGSMSFDIMDQSMGGNLESYILVDDENNLMDLYQKVDYKEDDTETTGEWMHDQQDLKEILEAFGVSSIKELQSLSTEDALGEDIKIEWAVAEQDNAYEVSGKLAFADLKSLIQQSVEAQSGDMDDETKAAVELVYGFMDPISVNISYVINKDTFATESIHMDLNDTDMEALNAMIAPLIESYYGAGDDEEIPEMVLSLEDISIDATYTYNDVAEIVVPSEASSATEIDVDELMNSAVDSVENN
ncbi:MAG: hypothetical protein Q4B15_05375 [Lachnospiraceae bacterium]|nr:hypothetical protein [Lachnospiraceae bacterium]